MRQPALFLRRWYTDTPHNTLGYQLMKWIKLMQKRCKMLEFSFTTSLVLLVFSVLPGHGAMGEKRRSDEERLLDYLFTDYNPSARPVLNSSKTVGVNLMFSLMHIQELVSQTFMLYHIHQRQKPEKNRTILVK